MNLCSNKHLSRGSWIAAVSLAAAFFLSTGCASRSVDPVDQPSTPPKPISAPIPEYPENAVQQRIFGRVMADVLVNEDGRVDRVEFPPGTNSELSASVAKTVRTWRFEPAQNRGRAVPAWIHIPFDFEAR